MGGEADWTRLLRDAEGRVEQALQLASESAASVLVPIQQTPPSALLIQHICQTQA